MIFPAAYFDGTSARRRDVRVELAPEGVRILENDREVGLWSYANLRHADAPPGTMRIGAEGAPELARLELRDAALIEALGTRAPDLRTRKHRDEADVRRIVLWSLAAVLSLALTALYLVPLVADRLAPLIPYPLERRIGEAVDSQVRALFGDETCAAPAGVAALEKLGARLAAAADLPMPVDIAVLPSDIPNAVALPGGNVYVFDGLLMQARNADELAGVLSHELGHVAGRDGLRKLLQAGGSAFLLGLLFGDVTGGGAIVFGAQALVDSRYSRGAESAADAFAAGLMVELGRSSKSLGEFLLRLTGEGDDRLAFLASHPISSERMRALAARDRPASGAPLLSNAEWQALKEICRVGKGA